LSGEIAENILGNDFRIIGVGSVDSEMESSKVGGFGGGYNRLDAIVTSEIKKKLLGASFLLDPDVSELVLKVVMNNQKIFFQDLLHGFGFSRRLVIIEEDRFVFGYKRLYSFPGEVHVGLRGTCDKIRIVFELILGVLG
jgi:hypothetical protein